MTVGTYLSQEGFEQRRDSWYSREINTTVTTTPSPGFYNISIEGHTYVEIHINDIPHAIDHCHNYTGTQLLVKLYNLQTSVKKKQRLAIKEDI